MFHPNPIQKSRNDTPYNLAIKVRGKWRWTRARQSTQTRGSSPGWPRVSFSWFRSKADKSKVSTVSMMKWIMSSLSSQSSMFGGRNSGSDCSFVRMWPSTVPERGFYLSIEIVLGNFATGSYFIRFPSLMTLISPLIWFFKESSEPEKLSIIAEKKFVGLRRLISNGQSAS